MYLQNNTVEEDDGAEHRNYMARFNAWITARVTRGRLGSGIFCGILLARAGYDWAMADKMTNDVDNRMLPENCVDVERKVKNELGCKCGNTDCVENELYCMITENKCYATPECSNTIGTAKNNVPCNCGGTICEGEKFCVATEPGPLKCHGYISTCDNQLGTGRNGNVPCLCKSGKVCTTVTPFCLKLDGQGHQGCYANIEQCENKDGTQNGKTADPCVCRSDKVCTTETPFCVETETETDKVCLAKAIKECTNTIGTISNFGSSNGTPCKCKKPKYDSLKPYEVCTTEKAFCDSVTATCRTSSLNPSYV